MGHRKVAEGEHVWIGISFRTEGERDYDNHSQFQATLAQHLAPLREGTGHTSLTQARTVTGQAQRLAQAVPEAQPWAAALWAALTEATWANEGGGQREAPPGRLPCVTFSSAARRFPAVLKGTILPL